MDTLVKVKCDLLDLFSSLMHDISPPHSVRGRGTVKLLFPSQVQVLTLEGLDPTDRAPAGPKWCLIQL